MLIPNAGEADILRSSQKDDYYTKRLIKDMNEVALALLGPKTWLHWRPLLESSSRYLSHYKVTQP